MTVVEERKQNLVMNAIGMFDGKSKEEANKVFEGLTITKITKAMMAVYIKNYATEEDKEWIKGDFKKASYKKAYKEVSTVCVDANGVPIHKKNKNGEVIVKRARVKSITGETYDKFDLSGARKEFVKHFNLTLAANPFKVKEKRTEKLFDEFDGLFD